MKLGRWARTVAGWLGPGLIWLFAIVLVLPIWVARDDAVAVAAIVTGALALAVAGWAVRGDRSKGCRRCPKCWYDMTGTGTTCPECGRTQKHERRFFRTRHRWRTAAACAVVAVGTSAYAGSRIHTELWQYVPTRVLYVLHTRTDWLPQAAESQLQYLRLLKLYKPGATRSAIIRLARTDLDSDDPIVRAFALDALGWMMAVDECADDFAAALDDPNAKVRERALWAIQTSGTSMRNHTDRLFELAESRTETGMTREWAVSELLHMEVRGGRIAALIRSRLQSNSAYVRSDMALRLGQYVDATRYAGDLLGIANDDGEDLSTRQDAFESLTRIEGLSSASKSLAAVAGMRLAKLYGNPTAQSELVASFGRLGPSAANSLPLLDKIELANGPSGELVAARIAILGQEPTLTDAWLEVIESGSYATWTDLNNVWGGGDYDRERARDMFIWLLTTEEPAGPYVAGRLLRYFMRDMDPYFDEIAPLARKRAAGDGRLEFEFMMWERDRIRRANLER